MLSTRFDFDAFPIITFYDSLWQDCVDTGRSTGAYHIYVNGSLVKSTTFVPIPIAHSSAEAEYNACAFALTDAIYFSFFSLIRLLESS